MAAAPATGTQPTEYDYFRRTEGRCFRKKLVFQWVESRSEVQFRYGCKSRVFLGRHARISVLIFADSIITAVVFAWIIPTFEERLGWLLGSLFRTASPLIPFHPFGSFAGRPARANWHRKRLIGGRKGNSHNSYSSVADNCTIPLHFGTLRIGVIQFAMVPCDSERWISTVFFTFSYRGIDPFGFVLVTRV